MSSMLHQILKAKFDAFKPAYEDLYNSVEPIAHGAKGADMGSILEVYILLEEIKEMMEGLVKACNIHEPELAEIASKLMMNMGLDSITKNGKKITPDIKTYVSVSKDGKPSVIRWLKQHVEGRELVSEDFNPNAFRAFIAKKIEESGYSKSSEDPGTKIPDEVSVFDKPILSIRKVKGRAE